uniref:WAP domain-containing protein n=1 Tax=Gopherus evgoodei TaxID=1825980 RepID=A0A8C4W1M9_9SAUR
MEALRAHQGLTALGHPVLQPAACQATEQGAVGPVGSQKCCNSGCGHTCTTLAQGGTVPCTTFGAMACSDRKPGFCPVHNGLYFSYDCEARCQGDGECPRDQKCCLRGCDYECLAPSEEKPGICPLTDGIPSSSPWCKSSCAEDKECAGDQKCCDSGCGRTCQAPEREKPGTCPKQKPWQTLVPCNEQDTCAHDRDCPRGQKCCSNGCGHVCMTAITGGKLRLGQPYPRCGQSRPCRAWGCAPS